MSEDPDQREPGASPARESGPAAWTSLVGIGLEFVATICAMGLIGWYLDRRWNTFPWLLVTGCAVGFAAGLMMMIRSGLRAFKD